MRGVGVFSSGDVTALDATLAPFQPIDGVVAAPAEIAGSHQLRNSHPLADIYAVDDVYSPQPDVAALLRRWQHARRWQERSRVGRGQLIELRREAGSALRDAQEEYRDAQARFRDPDNKNKSFGALFKGRWREADDELALGSLPAEDLAAELAAFTHVVTHPDASNGRLIFRMSGVPEQSPLTVLSLNVSRHEDWPRRIIAPGFSTCHVQELRSRYSQDFDDGKLADVLPPELIAPLQLDSQAQTAVGVRFTEQLRRVRLEVAPAATRRRRALRTATTSVPPAGGPRR